MSEQIVFPQSPAEFDAVQAEVEERYSRALSRVSSRVRGIMYVAKAKGALTPDQALEVTDPRARYDQEALREALSAKDDVWAEVLAFRQEFAARGGWSRFYMTQGEGGHIHSSMGCQTCNRNMKATRFSWLTDLSGMSEADAVKAYGAILCTVCFPSAPVEWTNGHELAAAAKQAERCSGSGKFYRSDLPKRTGFAAGNWVTCEDCGAKVAPTSGGKVRAHKPEEA